MWMLSDLLKLLQILFLIFATGLMAGLFRDFLAGKLWLRVGLGEPQNRDGEAAAILAILRANSDTLERISSASFLSREWVIALAIQHFGSLPPKEQWKLAEQYLANSPGSKP